MQDIEFTVQEGHALHPADALRQADRRRRRCASRWRCSRRRSASIGTPPCCGSSRPRSHQLLVKTVDPSARYTAIATGLPATPAAGGGQGRVRSGEGGGHGPPGRGGASWCARRPRRRTWRACTPRRACSTSRGGLTSHAAVVARGWGKCCVVGAGDVVVDEENRLFRAGRAVVREGQVITLNGATGEVIVGAQPLVDPKLSDEFRKLLGWAQDARDHHGPRQRGHAGGRGQGPRVRRGGHRPGAAPSTCSSGTSASRSCAR